MTATVTNASTLLVAIDISKHRHEVLIGIPGKTPSVPAKVRTLESRRDDPPLAIRFPRP